MKKLKTKGILLVAVLILALTGSGIVYAVQQLSEPNEADVFKASQLTQITRLDSQTILRLYKATGDWDRLTKNIAVYQEILSLVEGTAAESQFFHLIPKYEAADLYVAYDYFTANGLSFDGITGALDQRSKGEEWENILTGYGATPEYNNYRVLSKDELRQLLAAGYLPEDILKADNTARAKDLTLQEALQLTAGETALDNAAFPGREEPKRKMKITVPGVAYEVESPDALISLGRQKKEDRDREVKTNIKAEMGLTDNQMEAHLSQGFNPWEVRNAYRLARANGVSPREILDRKKSGQSWEEILAAYPNK